MNLHPGLAAVTDRASERERRSRQKPWHHGNHRVKKKTEMTKRTDDCITACAQFRSVILPARAATAFFTELHSPGEEHSVWGAAGAKHSLHHFLCKKLTAQNDSVSLKQTNTFPSALLRIFSMRLIITPTYRNLLN